VEIKLDAVSVVDKRSGEIAAPDEFLQNLQQLESSVQIADEEIEVIKTQLKRVKDRREQLITKLRSAVRAGEVLPLLEMADGDTDGDGMAYTPGWDDVPDDEPTKNDTGE